MYLEKLKRLKINKILMLVVFVICQFPNQGIAELDKNLDSSKSLSPYFFVKQAKEGEEVLPLAASDAKINIVGTIANVTITQSYQNRGNKPLEAIYIFPASTRAAVHAMRMTIGERVIVAKIKEKQAAKAQYIQAKKEGKSASLLEQHRPNVFQMNVANIMPNDQIKVILSYTEVLVPTDGVYEFVYPTVVGPRYSNATVEKATSAEKWIENPYLHEKEKPTYQSNLSVDLRAALPVSEILSPSHKVSIDYLSKHQVSLKLAKEETNRGNKDFILQYRLQGKKVDAGLLLYEGPTENFYLVQIEPPLRTKLKNVPPRDFIFVLDVSGSMYGYPLDITKKLIRELVSNLRPIDTFNILLFAGDNALFSEKSVPANQAEIKRAIAFIDAQQGSGGTELLPALNRALALPRGENFARSIVVVTDGYVSVETATFDLIRNNAGSSEIFAFGIGTSVNRFLIEGMARAGQGESFVVTSQLEAPEKASQFQKYIETPVLTDINVSFDGFDAEGDHNHIPNVLAQRPIMLLGKWHGERKGSITLSGRIGEKAWSKTIKIADAKSSKNNEALRCLWARKRIAEISDYIQVDQNSAGIKEVTALGLNYNLLTAYTSFIAVDETVRNLSGQQLTAKQPLPLPEGVSNLAVGGSIPTAPEPSTYLLLIMLSLTLAWSVIRKHTSILQKCSK